MLDSDTKLAVSELISEHASKLVKNMGGNLSDLILLLREIADSESRGECSHCGCTMTLVLDSNEWVHDSRWYHDPRRMSSETALLRQDCYCFCQEPKL